MQPQPDDNKSCTYDTSDAEGESGIWYSNESANESGSDMEVEGHSDVDEEVESRTKESRTQEEAKLQVFLNDIRWNRDGESSLRGAYGKGSKSSSQRQRKSTRDFEREASQTYNIGALWQQGRDLGLTSATTSQVVRPGEPSQLLPNNSISSAFSLSNIP